MEMQVPENELRKEGDRKLSEAELRIRRSLQRLDVPDWMKNAPTPQQGFLLRRRDYTPPTGWSAFSSKTGSMTSLGSSRATTPNTKFAMAGRASTRSYGGIASPAASVSPQPGDKDTSSFNYSFGRWSTSRLNSGTTTPTGSLTSQRTTSSSYVRQPYLGWRSNTSLASLGGSQSSLVGGQYLTPAERLAITLLPRQQQASAQSTDSIGSCNERLSGRDGETANVSGKVSDVHSSIKEVTSAIVHYCKDSPSPRSSPKLSAGQPPPTPKRKVWVESSFVGTRRINSPDSTTIAANVNGHQGEVVETRRSNTPDDQIGVRTKSRLRARNESRDSAVASINDSIVVLAGSSISYDSRRDSQNSFGDSGHSFFDSNCSISKNDAISENISRSSVGDNGSSKDVDSSSRNSGSSISRRSSGLKDSSDSQFDNSPRTANMFDDLLSRMNINDDLPPLRAEISSPNLLPDRTKSGEREKFSALRLQFINPRRFSDGTSPLNIAVAESKLKNDHSTLIDRLPSYGFNFSQGETNDGSGDDVTDDNITLDDVLDSLLAVPAKSRDPSPASESNHFTLSRPHTHHTLANICDTSSFKCDPIASVTPTFSCNEDLRKQVEDPRYTHITNQNFSTDPKIQSYHKSFSYNDPESGSSKDAYPCGGLNTSSSFAEGSTSKDYLDKEGELRTYFEQSNIKTTSKGGKLQNSFHNSFEDVPTPGTTALLKSQSFLSSGIEIAAHTTTSYVAHDSATAYDSNHCSFVNQLGPTYRTPLEDHLQLSEVAVAGEVNMAEEYFAPDDKNATEPTPKDGKVCCHLPPRHMNIPPDSSSENDNCTEEIRSEPEDASEVTDNPNREGLLVHCRNAGCNNSSSVEDAKDFYKMCHNCSIFYCSRSCRKMHWEKHKRQCEKIKAGTIAVKIIEKVKSKPKLLRALSAVAKSGTLTSGRGAVKIFFGDASLAQQFLNDQKNNVDAHYQPVANIMPQEMGSDSYKQIVNFCRNYNSEFKFIIYVSICTYSEQPISGSVKVHRETIAKYAKLRLSSPHSQFTVSVPVAQSSAATLNDAPDTEYLDTLILTTPSSVSSAQLPFRQSVLTNIVRELRVNGVTISQDFPDTYKHLADYVECGGSVSPMTIYPKNSKTGRKFTCVIYLDKNDSSGIHQLRLSSSSTRTVDVSKQRSDAT